MAKKRKSATPSHLLGSWSFLIGIILAVLLGLGYAGPWHKVLVLVVFGLGVIVGLFNVTHDKADHFMKSGLILVLVSYLGIQTGVFKFVAPVIANILTSILTLFVPATLIVVLKSVFSLARD